jgi:hypothetical protein
MRQAGIQCLYLRKRFWITVCEPAPGLVNRHFTGDSPDGLWSTDITEHPIEEGSQPCRDHGFLLPPDHRPVDQQPWRAELVTDALGRQQYFAECCRPCVLAICESGTNLAKGSVRSPSAP